MKRAKYLALDYGYVLLARLRTLRYGLKAPDYHDGDQPPVLILPGVFETWHYLKQIADVLHGGGHPVHVVQSLGFNRRPVTQSSGLVQEYLREHELWRVTIIAHSKGGLIGRRMMTVDDAEGRVERMIAVNSPFAGSPIARYALGRSWREFRPDHESVVELPREHHVNARITSIYSEYDQYVPGSGELPGAENIELPLTGHFRPLGHPLLVEKVLARVPVTG